MRTLSSLFAKSPFTPLQNHMTHVMACVYKVKDLFDLFLKGEHDSVQGLAEEISLLEHTADLTKNDIRNNLPKGLFLPVDRSHLLEILSIQDSIADKCEDIGILLSFRPFKYPKGTMKIFKKFLDKNIETIEMAHQVIQKLDELLESSFVGTEVSKVKELIGRVALLEHEVDVLQRRILKIVFDSEKDISYGTFFLIIRSIENLSSLSDNAEKLANRIRMTLDHK